MEYLSTGKLQKVRKAKIDQYLQIHKCYSELAVLVIMAHKISIAEDEM